ncbi:MAG TPA: pirin family protein [Kofleriaceae bacterium]|nr:pirin family protein [Kofleriaceae bacterium]
MIRLRRSAERQHDRHHKREVWRTFDPLDRLAVRFGALEAVDESRLPPRADVPRRVGDVGEIVTYVREGTVAYEDSMGRAGMIHAGEFQRMFTAHGARHSGANASRVDWAHVFQIRMRRSTPEREPEREQKRFSAAERRDGLCIVASPDARAGSLRLGQDTRIYSALLEPGQHVVHELATARAAWLHIVHGEVALDELALFTGDGAGVTTERAVSLIARDRSEILLFDVATAGRTVHDLHARRA